MEAAETARVRSALSSLGAVSGPPNLTYADMRAFEQKNHLRYLGHVMDATRYLPATVTKDQVRRTVDALSDKAADTGELRVALYELWLTTVRSRMADDDREAMLAVYVKKLSAYPPDVVWLTLKELADTAKFFPAWADIQALLDQRVGPRAALINALRHIYMKLET